VTRLIDCAATPLHRAVLMTMYSTGIRRSELVKLKVSDVDSQRMVIHIYQGKGNRDRQVQLSEKLLVELRDYWRWMRLRINGDDRHSDSSAVALGHLRAEHRRYVLARLTVPAPVPHDSSCTLFVCLLKSIMPPKLPDHRTASRAEQHPPRKPAICPTTAVANGRQILVYKYQTLSNTHSCRACRKRQRLPANDRIETAPAPYLDLLTRHHLCRGSPDTVLTFLDRPLVAMLSG
jgi:Phage integrase family